MGELDKSPKSEKEANVTNNPNIEECKGTSSS